MSGEKVYLQGIVKSVLSGDTVVIRGQPNQGPPPERLLSLAYIAAPKPGRRPNAKGEDQREDEPFAWQSREILRRLVIGRPVKFCVIYSGGSGHDFGQILVNGQDLTTEIVSKGGAKVRDVQDNSSDEHKALAALEQTAQFNEVGVWNKNVSHAVRKVQWNVSDMRSLVGKEYDGFVEQVRDGSTLRMFLLPSFTYVTVSLAGIKCPQTSYNKDGSSTNTEEYFEEAKYFTEVRLLNRSVKVILQGVANQTFLGTVLHPAGNISECLLKEGFARVVDWSLSCTTASCQNSYRSAEQFAKQLRLRTFRDYVPTAPTGEQKFFAKVTEIVNGESMMIKLLDGTTKRIYLSSTRQPKQEPEFTKRLKTEGVLVDANAEKEEAEGNGKKQRQTMFDTPWMYEARDFLRRRLIGKKVNVTIDYVKPGDKNFPEKTCCTVHLDQMNVAEALISRGLARVVFHRNDDDNRSHQYDSLREANDKAEQAQKGVYKPIAEAPLHRVTDVYNLKLAKQILPLIQHSKERIAAVCEHVIHGSRVRLYIPKDNTLLTFLVGGISCPKTGRSAGNGNEATESEPYADEAFAFTKELCLQRDVEVIIDGIDKGGNFTGSLWAGSNQTGWKHLALSLVSAGLAKVHPSANRLPNKQDMWAAEKKMKDARLKVWENYVEEVKVEAVAEEEQEREVRYTEVRVCDVVSTGHLWVQYKDRLEEMTPILEKMNETFTQSPPSAGFIPVENKICACKFVDGFWYRARIERINTANKTADVFYMDYGNKQRMPLKELYELPESFAEHKPLAHELFLACVEEPEDDDWFEHSVDFVSQSTMNNDYYLNVEYSQDGRDYVTLVSPTTREDVGKTIIANGLATCANTGGYKLRELNKQYKDTEELALSKCVNMWEYGDFRPTHAPEFGAPQKADDKK
eukprot:Awhi_evm1s1311